MTCTPKDILLISYHFPPSTAVGGFRIANFAKRLPMLGITPLVLTIKDRYVDHLDPSRLYGIDNIDIVKTIKIPRLLNVYFELRKICRHILRKHDRSPDIETSQSCPPNEPVHTNESAAGKLKRYFVSLFLNLPDPERNWIIPALLRALIEVRRRRISCFLTSSPPYSVHLVGLFLKQLTGIAWIADFRDPWVTPSTKRLYDSCALSERIEELLERKVINNSDLVLCNTERFLHAMNQHYAEIAPSRFLHIPNGFESALFAKNRAFTKFNQFTISYAGTLYLGRTVEPVFMALKALQKEGRIDSRQICIKLVGNCRYSNGRPTSDLVNEYGLQQAVEISDQVPYSTVVEILCRSHLCLLLAPDQPYQIPAKIYDYIASGTSVLALAGDGATSDLIKATGTGLALNPTDIDGIKSYIYERFLNSNSMEKPNSLVKVDRFDTAYITETLVKNIHSAIFNNIDHKS